MSKILLVDTNFSSMPIYKSLVEMGHEVHVAGNNPLDTLGKISNHYWNCDYSDVKKLSEVIEKSGADKLIAGCTDRSYESCSLVGAHHSWMGDNHENFCNINNKSKLRNILKFLDIPSPRVFSDIEQIAGFPVIIKPVDSYSGSGISLLRNPVASEIEQARRIAKSVSKTNECIIEEFVQGQLYSHSAFIRKENIVADFFVQEDCVASPFSVDTSKVVDGPGNEIIRKIRNSIARIIRHLNLSDGLMHTQFICHENDYWIIEITRRCPGDLYAILIELSTGFPYAKCYSSFFTGDEFNFMNDSSMRKNIMRHTLTPKIAGRMECIKFERPVCIERLVATKTAGDQLETGPKGRAGIVFLSESNAEKLDQLYQMTLQGNLYNISTFA